MIGSLFRTRPQPGFSSYVALGDSLTAGNGCDPRSRWPDLLVEDLRLESPGLAYVNLARDGADSADVLGQIPEAIERRPDLVTVICGANDIILSLRPDIPTFSARFELILDRLKRGLPDALVLTSTYPEGWTLAGVGPRTQSRIDAGMSKLNRSIMQIAESRGVPCLNVSDHPGIRDPENFEPDGLHPSAAGHRHAANEFRKAMESR